MMDDRAAEEMDELEKAIEQGEQRIYYTTDDVSNGYNLTKSYC